MGLEGFLLEHKGSILPRWLDSLFEVYPSGSHAFLRGKKDRFANPVGYTLSMELERLYEAVARDAVAEEIGAILENIMKIRAVQDLKPSQALQFILELKGLVRKELKSEGSGGGSRGDLEAFEEKIDKICLEGFDIYSRCRQKIFDLRVSEVKRQVSRLMERANLVCEIPDVTEDL